jgi:hypothetical protein
MSSPLPRVRFVQGQQIINGDPCDSLADVVEQEAVITDTPDRFALAVRAFECGVEYGRAEAEEMNPVSLVPITGRASSRPLNF